ncbi:MAG: calcium/sodium antiporter [Deltaproteobacteria bacterium]|nr:calcium/sodium antiporter [Deltaproteobacteria bacterium]
MLEILENLALVGLSIVMLWKCSDWLVESAARVGRRLGFSELTTGLVIVSICTSAPEFAVSVMAALQDKDDISVGNVVGSNIFNLGIILGLCTLIRSMPTNRRLVLRDGGILIATTLALVLMLHDGHLSRVESVLLLAGLAGYIGLLIFGKQELDEELPEDPMTWRDPLWLIAGMVGVVGGGELLVVGASELARMAGVSEWAIAVTIVAGGTSTPELAASLRAALSGRSGMSIGNLVGSDIFNMLGVLGAAGLIRPMSIGSDAQGSLVMLVGMCVVAVGFMRSGWRLSRWEGAVLLVAALARWGVDLGT